jgi:hypothetical protein
MTMAAAFHEADLMAEESESSRDIVSVEWAEFLKQALEEAIEVSHCIYPVFTFNVHTGRDSL